MADNVYRFLPADAPTVEILKQYVDDNLNRISNALELIEQTNIPFLGRYPERLTDGMIIRANGEIPNGWSPDGLKGTYVYWADNDPSERWERLTDTFMYSHFALTGQPPQQNGA